MIQIRPLIVSLARVIRIHHGHRSVNHKQSDSLTCGYHTARAIQIRPLIVSPARVIRIRPIKKSPARVTPPLAPHPTIGIMKFTFAVRRHELRIRFPQDRILWHLVPPAYHKNNEVYVCDTTTRVKDTISARSSPLAPGAPTPHPTP